ncbi:MAG: hypothetical protein Crog4KO_15720 [Crocinitomicaceae bacterium]
MGAYDDGTRAAYYPDEILSIAVSPLALIDSYNGSAYKLGFSLRPSRSLRLTADAGGYVPGLSSSVSDFDNLSGYHFRSSFGLTSASNASGHAFGLSYQYKRQDFTYEGKTVPSPIDYVGAVSKYAHSYNLYYARDLRLGLRFFLEFRAEAGVRYREIFNSHNDLVSDTEGWRDSWFSGRITNQKRLIPNFAITVRLNYSVWLR